MVYGLNFNRVPIPANIGKRFAKRLDSKFRPVSGDRGCDFILQAVCETEEEFRSLMIAADNGRRKFHRTERLVANPKARWIGLYIG